MKTTKEELDKCGLTDPLRQEKELKNSLIDLKSSPFLATNSGERSSLGSFWGDVVQRMQEDTIKEIFHGWEVQTAKERMAPFFSFFFLNGFICGLMFAFIVYLIFA